MSTKRPIRSRDPYKEKSQPPSTETSSIDYASDIEIIDSWIQEHKDSLNKPYHDIDTLRQLIHNTIHVVKNGK